MCSLCARQTGGALLEADPFMMHIRRFRLFPLLYCRHNKFAAHGTNDAVIENTNIDERAESELRSPADGPLNLIDLSVYA